MVEDDSNVPSPDWWDAMATLNGHLLPIIRVTKTAAGQVTVIWRNQPTDAQKAAAEGLIGAAGHAW